MKSRLLLACLVLLTTQAALAEARYRITVLYSTFLVGRSQAVEFGAEDFEEAVHRCEDAIPAYTSVNSYVMTVNDLPLVSGTGNLCGSMEALLRASLNRGGDNQPFQVWAGAQTEPGVHRQVLQLERTTRSELISQCMLTPPQDLRFLRARSFKVRANGVEREQSATEALPSRIEGCLRLVRMVDGALTNR